MRSLPWRRAWRAAGGVGLVEEDAEAVGGLEGVVADIDGGGAAVVGGDIEGGGAGAGLDEVVEDEDVLGVVDVDGEGGRGGDVDGVAVEDGVVGVQEGEAGAVVMLKVLLRKEVAWPPGWTTTLPRVQSVTVEPLASMKRVWVPRLRVERVVLAEAGVFQISRLKGRTTPGSAVRVMPVLRPMVGPWVPLLASTTLAVCERRRGVARVMRKSPVPVGVTAETRVRSVMSPPRLLPTVMTSPTSRAVAVRREVLPAGAGWVREVETKVPGEKPD